MASGAFTDDISREAFFAAEGGVRSIGDLLLVDEVLLIDDPESFRSRRDNDLRWGFGICLLECSDLGTVLPPFFLRFSD